jgi:hypothetical protein
MFSGGSLNEARQRFIVDSHRDDAGQFAGGWSLQIAAEADVQVQERFKDTTRKKRGNRHH